MKGTLAEAWLAEEILGILRAPIAPMTKLGRIGELCERANVAEPKLKPPITLAEFREAAKWYAEHGDEAEATPIVNAAVEGDDAA